jgi:hypothetical protein
MSWNACMPIGSPGGTLRSAGLLAAVCATLALAASAQAATLTEDVVIPGAPVSVTTTSPLALGVDFGTAFVSLERVVITSTFDVSDLFQINDEYLLVDGDGLGVRKSQSSVTPTAISEIIIQGGPELDVFLDGQWDFEYQMARGSVSLASLSFAATGVPVPEPSTALLLAMGLVGLAARSGRRLV